MSKKAKNLIMTIVLFIIVIVYTLIVKKVDVSNIGPNNSLVGLYKVNEFFHEYIGSNMTIYNITKYLGYIPIFMVFIYALIGLLQLIKRKSLKKVDKELYILAIFYVIILSVYILFEKVVINYRPILMNGKLDPSYPSSHTLLAICICGSSIIINNILFKKNKLAKLENILSLILIFAITVGRFISGVHWFTDIIGGIIISLFLLQLFNYLLLLANSNYKLNIKKTIIYVIVSILLGSCSVILYHELTSKVTIIDGIKYNKDGIPIPEVTSGIRGELGIDKNVNEVTIDNYLGRKDSVYRDMRMIEDFAQYEEIGGNRFLDGYIDGFEIVPFPYIIPVKNLPKEVGETYTGQTLFTKNESGKYIPVYNESIPFIEKYFPKNKYIFLMCGGGGYAGMMKEFLVSMGWDADKIWVVGGYWYYTGNHNIKLPELEYGYDTTNVPYHDIDFTNMTRIREKKKGQIELSSRYYDTFENDEYYAIYESADDYNRIITEQGKYIDSMKDKKESFVLVFHDYEDACSDELMFSGLTSDIAFKYDVFFYSVEPDVYKNTSFFEDYRFVPGILVINKGEVYEYIDGNHNITKEIYDAEEYNDKVKILEDWLLKYVKL